MAVLSAEDRKRMPAKEFGGPNRSFPMNDANHQRMAISGATRSEHAGNISESEADRIKAEARAKLGDKGGDPDHKAAVGKMHPKHLHDLVEHARSGKAGPEAKKMADMAMQPQQQDAPQQGGKDYSSMFSGGPAPQAPPQSSGNPFGGN